MEIAKVSKADFELLLKDVKYKKRIKAIHQRAASALETADIIEKTMRIYRHWCKLVHRLILKCMARIIAKQVMQNYTQR